MEITNIGRKWIVKEPGNPAAVRRLAQELGTDPVLANLLVQRGITTYEEARTFFRPDLSMLHDPFLMKDMEKAVERVHRAITNNEKILVYGDYDVDGTSAVSLVYTFLSTLTQNLEYYIPVRYDEGYGISYKGIDWAYEGGYTLVIALDCGIKAVEKVQYAKERGIDFIICDHHLPDETLPEAVAILDPKRDDCHYPFDDLSGCGVGFKLVQGYAKKYGIPFEQIVHLLDLVAVSIATDLVSVTGENRVLAFYGLKQLNEAPRKGLLSMIKLSGLEKHTISIDDIVFKIGPRINAAGRMESGRMAVDLLTSRREEDALNIGKEINVHNNELKNVDREITVEAIEMVKHSPDFEVRKSTVVYNPQWHKGVVGIVASRLVEAYYKPTIVLTNSNGFVTGSARSIPGFDLYEAIESCSDLLENFGGHMYAAGLTMKPENVEAFTKRFNDYVDEHIDPQILVPQVDIDSELMFSDITPAFHRQLNSFQPFGPGNTAPVFVSRAANSYGDPKLVGADLEHLRMDLMQQNSPHSVMQTIAFQQPTHYEWIRSGRQVDVCYQVVENHYRGTVSTQLRIKDIKRTL